MMTSPFSGAPVAPILCAHCKFPITPDGRIIGPDRRVGWVHGNGRGYTCRDGANVLLSTHATPPPPDWPALNMASRPR